MQSEIQTTYEEKVEQTDTTELDAAIEAAQAYNRRLVGIIKVFEDGKVGKALLAMPYKSHASFNIPAGFLKDSGCIEFWAKIVKSSPQIGDGGDPRLFTFTFADTHTPACKIDLVSNDGGGNSGFATCSWFAGIANIRDLQRVHGLPALRTFVECVGSTMVICSRRKVGGIGIISRSCGIKMESLTSKATLL